jgi:CheY-like chemotaxis protein
VYLSNPGIIGVHVVPAETKAFTLKPPGKHMNQYSILLVEDEPDVRHFLMRAIQRTIPNVSVTAAADGRAAVEQLHIQVPELIISDHRMPRMTGIELLIYVRTNWSMPFILISADPIVQTQALAAGASMFLAKPMSLSQLRSAIEQLLNLP